MTTESRNNGDAGVARFFVAAGKHLSPLIDELNLTLAA
jgi:hypothetical protein